MTIYNASKTLVGCFDIYAYSGFIKKYPMDECLSKVQKLFIKIRKDAGSFDRSIRVKHWIFSDTIIVTPDLDSYPLDPHSIDFFLLICAVLIYRGITNELPFRGAIGGGYFYKNDEIILSSALVDAHEFEQAQKWFGTVITPAAVDIIRTFIPEFGKVGNLPNSHRHLRIGTIPWKKDKSNNLSINVLEDFFYIVPPQIVSRDWTEYLPTYLDYSKCEELINNSHRIYRKSDN